MWREAEGWIRAGLRPRAITRDLDWGVPVPLSGWDDRRLYVWFDAVIGYLSASIEWSERSGDPYLSQSQRRRLPRRANAVSEIDVRPRTRSHGRLLAARD